MKLTTITLAATFLSALSTPGFSQQGQAPSGAQTARSDQQAMELPEVCRTASQASGQGQMQNMQGNTSQTMQGMTGQMTDAQKGYHEAMMKMNGPMMQGMMAKDADVAWACAMIPHHQGAIDMARVVLKTGDNAELKKMAEKTLKEQEKEITDLKEWLQKHASRELRNEGSGSSNR